MANKDKIKKKEEKRLIAEDKIRDVLKQSKFKEKKYLDFIQEKFNTNNKDKYVVGMYSLYKKWDEKNKKSFFTYLKNLDKNTDLVNDEHIGVLAKLFDFNLFWIERENSFKKKTNNTSRQLENLINHLFSKYKIPLFALNIWTQNSFKINEFDWFMHLAEGNNLKNANKLPFELTKKEAHYANSAPDDYSFIQAMVWGLLTSLGCSVHLKKEICAHPVSSSGTRMAFWKSIFVFFRENTMLDFDQVRPLIDYICHLKYSNGAPLPNFSIKGRNPAQLLEQMGDWHKETARVQAENQRIARNERRIGGNGTTRGIYKKIDYEWISKYNNWSLTEGTGNKKKNWRIVELTSSAELREEGGSLGHCVASYDSKCNNGSISIFSLSLNDKKQFTIEVRDGSIQQVRGKRNSRLDPVSYRILDKWATNYRLQISSSL